MAPALLDGQHVQTWPLNQGLPWDARLRGCIVAFRAPFRPEQIYVKRVVGLSDEHVSIVNGRVEIDGELLPEPYLATPGIGNPGGATQWMTDRNEVFLLGDNRDHSDDSRSFGPVSADRLIGRVWIRYWPPRRFRTGS